MHDAPSLYELIEAVKGFIDETAAPQLTGHAAFHARVASNVLATAMRELSLGEAFDEKAVAALQKLLDRSDTTDLDTLNGLLCDAIRDDELDEASAGLLNYLKMTTKNQLAVDQPHYSGIKPE